MHDNIHTYAIQINPNSNPGRIKFGRTNNVENRLSQFRTSCPNARKVYSLDEDAEASVFAALQIEDWKCIGGEVWEIPEGYKTDDKSILSAVLEVMMLALKLSLYESHKRIKNLRRQSAQYRANLLKWLRRKNELEKQVGKHD